MYKQLRVWTLHVFVNIYIINLCQDWQSLDESWDSRLPTPLALDFSSLRDEDDNDENMTSNTQRSYSNGNAEESYPNGDDYQAKGQYAKQFHC